MPIKEVGVMSESIDKSEETGREAVRAALRDAIDRCQKSQSELARQMTACDIAKQKYVQQHIWHWLQVGRVPAEHVRVIELVSGIPAHRLCPEVFLPQSDKAA